MPVTTSNDITILTIKPLIYTLCSLWIITVNQLYIQIQSALIPKNIVPLYLAITDMFYLAHDKQANPTSNKLKYFTS